MADVPLVTITDGIPTGGTGTVQSISTITDRVGEVQASPTANTLLERLKALKTSVDGLAAGIAATFNANVSTSADAHVATADFASPVVSYLYGYNGTTWDRLRSDTTNGLDVDVTRLPALAAGTNNIGGVSLRPETANGLSLFRSLDLDETEEDVKTSAGCLYKLRITNRATTARFVKLYNDTAANVIVGTTAPLDTIVVPAATSADVCTVLTESFGGLGLMFSAAISIAATTGLADNDTGAPGANDVVVSAYYK